MPEIISACHCCSLADSFPQVYNKLAPLPTLRVTQVLRCLSKSFETICLGWHKHPSQGLLSKKLLRVSSQLPQDFGRLTLVRVAIFFFYPMLGTIFLVRGGWLEPSLWYDCLPPPHGRVHSPFDVHSPTLQSIEQLPSVHWATSLAPWATEHGFPALFSLLRTW